MNTRGCGAPLASDFYSPILPNSQHFTNHRFDSGAIDNRGATARIEVALLLFIGASGGALQQHDVVQYVLQSGVNIQDATRL